MGVPMRRSWRWIKLLALSFLLLLLAAIGVAYQQHKVEKVKSRLHLVGLKVTGELPYVSWPALVESFIPSELRDLVGPKAAPPKEVGAGEPPCSSLWDTSLGQFWGRRSDAAALQLAVEQSQFDARYRSGPTSIRKGDVVLDGGSNLGTFTRFVFNRGARKVIAVEPDPTSNACFKRTFAKEISDGRVVLVEAALWNTPGKVLKFAETSDSLTSAVYSVLRPTLAPDRIIAVPTTTIDLIVQTLRIDRLDFLELNIEGSEREALSGASLTLSRFHPRMKVSINHRPDDPTAVPRVALSIDPSYRVFTDKLEQAYFY
jgi:FkbM family methyltransferase